jgi:hypothetical protein
MLVNIKPKIMETGISYHVDDRHIIQGQHDFISLGTFLHRHLEPKEYLKYLKGHLKPKGIVQMVVIPLFAKPEVEMVTRFDVPTLSTCLLRLGYKILERLCIETEQGLVVCAQMN